MPHLKRCPLRLNLDGLLVIVKTTNGQYMPNIGFGVPLSRMLDQKGWTYEIIDDQPCCYNIIPKGTPTPTLGMYWQFMLCGLNDHTFEYHAMYKGTPALHNGMYWYFMGVLFHCILSLQ